MSDLWLEKYLWKLFPVFGLSSVGKKFPNATDLPIVITECTTRGSTAISRSRKRFLCMKSDFTGPFEPFHHLKSKLVKSKIWGLNDFTELTLKLGYFLFRACWEFIMVVWAPLKQLINPHGQEWVWLGTAQCVFRWDRFMLGQIGWGTAQRVLRFSLSDKKWCSVLLMGLI